MDFENSKFEKSDFKKLGWMDGWVGGWLENEFLMKTPKFRLGTSDFEFVNRSPKRLAVTQKCERKKITKKYNKLSLNWE